MDINKFDLTKLKYKNRTIAAGRDKIYHYYSCDSIAEVRKILEHEAEAYVRKVKKIPYDKQCITYTTEEGKIAVLALDTPKKRFLFKQAQFPYISGQAPEPMYELRKKYGFIPSPINVLHKYVKYGFITSQDAEHLYHNEPVDYKISDNLQEFERAYSLHLEEKDVLVDNFNGYSCMSEEPRVGMFYYYFGAYMLIFYKKGTDEMVGRMVLWKHEDKLYAYKGYVQTRYQFAASATLRKLKNDGVIEKDSLPGSFSTSLQRMKGKTPQQIYDSICDDARVPYVDEDLVLSDDKTELSFDGENKLKGTACNLLSEYGYNICEECGVSVCEDDTVWIDDECYCCACARKCECCHDWFRPDADGDYVEGEGWICENCLSANYYYYYCDQCEKYVNRDDSVEVKDEDGDWIDMCKDCAEENCKTCKDCGDWFVPKETDDEYCYDCKEKTLEMSFPMM